MSAKQELPVIVGRIRSAWGLRGDVGVEVLSDAPERFAVGASCGLRANPHGWSTPARANAVLP